MPNSHERPVHLLALVAAPAAKDPRWQALNRGLEALACTVLLHEPRHSLVRDPAQPAPEAQLLWPHADAELDAMLAALQPNLPAVLLAAALPAPLQKQAFDAGVQLCLPADVAPQQLLDQLRWATWQQARTRALQTQLDDRKWTERAKGLLMTAQDIDEAAAFRLLRDAAMLAHLRLGEVSRSVVEAAQLAEALNLAGQQRMLSQRLVKLLAQRAAAIEPRRAKQLQDESCARVETNLQRLQTLLPAEPGLAAVQQSWAALRALLGGKPSMEALHQADAAAEALLDCSERLSATLEAAGARKPLALVNLCGRQRMLTQRLAKQALLADMLPDYDAAASAAALGAFEAGLTQLDAAPLSTREIRAVLDEVRAEWLRLLRSLRDTHGREAAAGLARSSEQLLTLLDRLTAQYQQSLQVILG